eukprot:gene38352-51799_t
MTSPVAPSGVRAGTGGDHAQAAAERVAGVERDWQPSI